MNEDTLITLTADIVSAHLANNHVSMSDVPTVIASVHQALATLGREVEPEAISTKREPAVSVRSSVKPDAISCLICGKRQKTLKRHLRTAHDLTPEEYRAEFDLKADYPLVASDYATKRRELAHSIGLGRKRAEPEKPKRSRKPRNPPAEAV
jgi:predicted transcriptional regulator